MEENQEKDYGIYSIEYQEKRCGKLLPRLALSNFNSNQAFLPEAAVKAGSVLK